MDTKQAVIGLVNEGWYQGTGHSPAYGRAPGQVDRRFKRRHFDDRECALGKTNAVVDAWMSPQISYKTYLLALR